MRCPACDAENPEAARFCASCGGQLTVACPHCQAPVGLGVRFCMSCGAAIAAAASDRPSTAGEADSAAPAERRRVSVLFMDLVNFTALAEALDPEEVRIVQSRYFEVARSIVARYGGTIEKFIGDAVMAVWGAPITHEDDAVRAVRAALEIVDAVGRLGGAASGSNLSARAAVATGQAAVTVGAVGQGMVAGDLVNVAARLQDRAPPGGVLVDESTKAMAQQAAGFEPIGSISLKGRSRRLAAFRASPMPASEPRDEHGPHSGPFVGRDRELRELTELFGGVTRDCRSRLVSITGIAGIGKSRLAWEFHEHLDALPEDVAWHAGRAPAYGEEITFAAVAEMVRRRIRIADGAPPALARRQLGVALEEFVRDEEERQWMEPRVAVLLGGDGAETFDREELFAAWRRFFERVSDRAPAVLVFEDLQWADPSLLDFVEHLATWTRDHPILVVALARPELLDRRPGWGTGIGSFTALHLERLPDEPMRDLLAVRAPRLPEGALRLILDRAGGVPLYAVEVLRILADRDHGPRASDRRAARRAESAGTEPFEVPDSLHGLIAARIDALPLPERRLLLAAAVLGRRFRPDSLVAVAETDPAQTRERIDRLVRRELLAVDDERSSPGRGDLAFVQDLVREVAYDTLARSQRRALHLAAARHLESRDDDRLAESLAGHLLEVHRMAPDHPDAHRIARRAVAALRRAAHDALRLHAPERAGMHLEQALRLTVEPRQRGVLLGEAAQAARAAARLELAEQHLRELLALRVAGGMPHEATRARAELASVLLMAQRNDSALAELESAVEAIDDIGADASGVELAAQLARARVLVGDDRAGLEWADRALEAARRLDLKHVEADLRATRGTALVRLGDDDAGLAELRAAIAAAETADALAVELRARNNLAWLSVADDPRATFDTARMGYELASTMGVGDLAVQLADVACAAAVHTGDWAWALDTVDTLERAGISEAYRIELGVSSAIIRAIQGHPRPMANLDAMEPLPDAIDPQLLAAVHHARAWIAFVGGQLDDARRFALEAAVGSLGAERAHQLTLAAHAALWLRDGEAVGAGIADVRAMNLRGRAIDASCLTLEAGLMALAGRDGAAVLYDRAGEAWRELGLPLDLALCLVEAQQIGGVDHIREAGNLLEQLGADALVPFLDGIRSSAFAPRSAQSRQPSVRIAAPTGAGRRPRRATGPPRPSG